MRTASHRFTLSAAVAALAAGSLALAGCAVTPDDGDGGHLRVVTTTTQLTDFARIVGGDDVTISGLMAPGSSAHHFDPSPAELLELSRADVLIVNGQGLDTYIDGAIEASGFAGEIIDASSGVDLVAARAATERAAHEAEDATEHAEHAHEDEHADEHAAEETAEEGHDGHDHGESDVNPHLWTAPMMAAGMVDAVADGLAAADPEHATGFQDRAEAYQQLLADLDDWAAAQFARVPPSERILVSGHDSLRYFLDAYEIAFAGSILPSFEDNAEPSVAEIDALVAKIQEQGVRAIFVESTMNPKLARTIARESGATVIDSDTLAVDALGVPGSDTDTYLAATEHNVRVILEAWGFTPDPLPESLQEALQ
ncbi:MULTISPECIES: metal ABC transporter substrate-binding protein [unclassified Leucobacter]|uniref:metal ABC transporter substrate-binding protein n=1 Tax=unclassified Leucobacter TaxID=2621730 RepID=UPI00165E9FB3|nr:MULTISPECIES: metal ABC transporter substrate-binding protein [unclassified Leucobacter]MBC9936310.1 zinc ABC transporter substrate-binding protein [Leucobacter sp. cx-87]